MVDDGYFDHTAPDGTTFVDRILGAGYAKRDSDWTLGENLAGAPATCRRRPA